MPRIALDFTSLDHATSGTGHYRYVLDLVRGLHALQPDMEFVLFGSRPKPAPEIADIFQTPGWRYRQLTHSTGRGAYYLDHLKFSYALLRERVDLLHSVHSFIPLFAPCPVVVTEHDLMFELFEEYRAARSSNAYVLYKWEIRNRARRIISISQNTAADLQKLWNVDADKIDVVHHGCGTSLIDACRAQHSERLPMPDDWISSPLLLSPYNLEPRKNLTKLLEAVALLRGRYPKLKLILFGRGALTPQREADFAERLQQLGIADIVQLLGFVDDGDLAWLYRHCTVFVFPTLYEGFGLPVLEAMACGACVVARNASAMAEVAGQAALLVETQDSAMLADGISTLLDDPDLQDRLRRAGMERSAMFTVEKMAKLTYQTYLKAIRS